MQGGSEMAWNTNYYPGGYQMGTYNPYQNALLQQPQTMTPTIRAEIIQVDSEQTAAAYPVGAGSSQMMIAKDDSAIYVKTALANGQSQFDVFEKRAPLPPAPSFDASAYVTHDELERRLKALKTPQNATGKDDDE